MASLMLHWPSFLLSPTWGHTTPLSYTWGLSAFSTSLHIFSQLFLLITGMKVLYPLGIHFTGNLDENNSDAAIKKEVLLTKTMEKISARGKH